MSLGAVGRRVLLRTGLLAGAAALAFRSLDKSRRAYAYTGTPTPPEPALALNLADDAGGRFELSHARPDVS